MTKLVVKGVNKKGDIFRPSSWAERISSVGAIFGADQRLQYSPLLHPEITNGLVCLVIDPLLEVEKPDVYSYVMSFVEANDLVTDHDEVA